MTTSTQDLETAEKILSVIHNTAKLDATASIQLAAAYMGLAATKVAIENQAALREQLEQPF
jgi:hypothetical protein